MEIESIASLFTQWTVWQYAEHQVHLTGCTDRFMLSAREMCVCETSLIYPKPCDLDLRCSKGTESGLPHQREWFHNSQFSALCLRLLFSPDRRKSAKNVPSISALSRLMSSFCACHFFFRNGQLIAGRPSFVNTADSPAVFRCILFACNFRGFFFYYAIIPALDDGTVTVITYSLVNSYQNGKDFAVTISIFF
jgi:hypothetical protein